MSNSRRPPPKQRVGAKGRTTLFPIVGIGTSAGGLEAATDLLKHLPLDTGFGFVLVQHLDPQHESALVQLLSRSSRLPVSEITDRVTIEPNHVYVIPPNTTVRINQGLLLLQPRQKARLPYHPIDTFLESLAEQRQERAIGAILSGTGTDGTLGLEAIKGEGGITFAQNSSAKYDSMPRSAIASGNVDFVLSPENIAKELSRIATHPYITNDGGGGRVVPRQNRRHSPQFRKKTRARNPMSIERGRMGSRRFLHCCAITPASIFRSIS